MSTRPPPRAGVWGWDYVIPLPRSESEPGLRKLPPSHLSPSPNLAPGAWTAPALWKGQPMKGPWSPEQGPIGCKSSLGPSSVSVPVSFSLGSPDPSFHPTETQGGAGLRWRGWGSQDWAGGGSREKKAGNIREPGLVGSTEEGVGGGRGKGAEEWGRAQQLSLRGDRCFLIGVFGALSHPGTLAPRVAPAALLEAATNPHNDSNNCDASFA